MVANVKKNLDAMDKQFDDLELDLDTLAEHIKDAAS